LEKVRSGSKERNKGGGDEREGRKVREGREEKRRKEKVLSTAPRSTGTGYVPAYYRSYV